MEQRFGAPVAAAAAFSILGCIILGAGVVLNQRSTKHTFDMIADLRASDAEIRRADTSVERERARLERDQFNHNARFAMLDAQRVNQLADQKTRLLVDAARESWNLQQQQAQPAAAWAMDDDNDGAGVRYYE
jgi:multidrug resistance efflux pump